LVLGVKGIAAIAVGELEPFRLELDGAIEVVDRLVVLLDLVIVLAAVDVGIANLQARGARRVDDAGAGRDRIARVPTANLAVIRGGRRRRRQGEPEKSQDHEFGCSCRPHDSPPTLITVRRRGGRKKLPPGSRPRKLSAFRASVEVAARYARQRDATADDDGRSICGSCAWTSERSCEPD